YFTPGELIIPALDVYQTVTEAPLVNNRWELRYLGKNVAWLPPSGYFPGDEFSMVFAAHVTDYDGQRGPFYHLRNLSAGNEVIYRWNGNEYRYVVTGSEVVAPYEVEKLFVNNGNGLLLVTCTNWDSGVGAYADRIIIYASLTSTTPLY
ncbi:MAG TPA: sortase, partial [Anaerolineales bacterium]|nr:sortase [Anaerolineales bacterium]